MWLGGGVILRRAGRRSEENQNKGKGIKVRKLNRRKIKRENTH